MCREVVRGITPIGALSRTLLLFGAACGTGSTDYQVIAEFPHDTSAYTQGLLWHDGWLYESTGRYDHSELRRVNPATGTVDARQTLPPERFGEGLALLGDRLYQLTWHSAVAYVYDVTTLALLDSLHYDGEGWGLTSDGTHLIMSNGTATLRFLDPATFAIARELQVTDHGAPLPSLNELEFVNGELFANIYQSGWIVRISLETGEVLQWIDFARLLPDRRRSPTTDVLNGIAQHPSGDLLVTGKLWPRLYRVRLR